MHFLLPCFRCTLLWKIIVPFCERAASDKFDFSTIFRTLDVHTALACYGRAPGYQKHAALYSQHIPVDAPQVAENKMHKVARNSLTSFFTNVKTSSFFDTYLSFPGW